MTEQADEPIEMDEDDEFNAIVGTNVPKRLSLLDRIRDACDAIEKYPEEPFKMPGIHVVNRDDPNEHW